MAVLRRCLLGRAGFRARSTAMAFRATGISAGPAGATGTAALAAVFAAGSARAAAMFAIATVAWAALGPSRAEFIHAEVPVAIRIKPGKGCCGIGDLHRVDDSVTVGVEGGDDRGHWASAAFGAGRVSGVGVSGGQAQGGSGGGHQEGLVDEFHGCVSVCCFVFLGGGSALVSRSINTRGVKG